MGYNLYITRRSCWFDEEPEISAEEWHDYVARDHELRMDASLGDHFAVWSGPSTHEIPWLAWVGGNIESKNPDQPLIRKMTQIAQALGASVQGEECESYDDHGQASPPPKPSLLERLKRWWGSVASRGAPPIDASEVPFKVGERVRSIVGPWHGTVMDIDLSAEHGLGRITVRRDDGSIIYSAAIAHGLTREAGGEHRVA